MTSRLRDLAAALDHVREGSDVARLAAPPPHLALVTLNSELSARRDPPPLETPENVARLRAALAVVSADCPYPEWRDITFSIHAHGWEQGEDIARAWSVSARDRFDEDAFLRLWTSASGDGGITHATVYYRANMTGLPWGVPTDVSVTAADADSATLDPRGDAHGDIGNARLFAAQERGRLLFIYELGIWLMFHPERGWIEAPPGETLRAAMRVVDRLRRLAAERYKTDPDSPQTKALMAHVRRSSDLKRLEAMVKLAAAESGMTVRANELDADPLMLGAPNGVLDLRRLTLLAPHPDLLVTKRTTFAYDPGATALRWIAFLERVLPDPEIRAYLQRFAGYLLTGLVSGQCFVFLYGGGANGKSVFVEVLRRLLGSYGIVIPSQVLMASRRDAGAPSPELVQLQGARLALFNETEDGSRFAESQLKTLTGGDALTARGLYSAPVTFLPTHKLLGVGNHRPVISGTDLGIWRRVHLVPFNVTIPEEERDPRLLDALLTEGSGILNWMLDGLVAFNQCQGLRPPRAVLDAVKDYRESCDVLGDWLNEHTEPSVGAFVRTRDLYDCYKSWAHSSGWHPLTIQSFGRRLTDRGFRITNHGSGAARAKSVEGLVLHRFGVDQ